MKRYILVTAFLILGFIVHAVAIPGDIAKRLESGKRTDYEISQAATEPVPGPTLQPCDELVDDVAIMYSADNVYKFNQISSYWAVVGLRPDPGSDWDLSFFSDSCGEGFEYAYSWSYADSTEFVVTDYNHAPTGWEGIWIGLYAGSGSARIEYENGEDVLDIGSNTGIEWPAGDVVEIWDVNLDAGVHPISLVVTSGSADLGMAIFESNGSAYYAGRREAAAASDGSGGGGDEYLEYDAPRDDWYGFVVWANNDIGAIFDIDIGAAGIGDGGRIGTALPTAFALDQNHPNPFNPSTMISYQLPEGAIVALTIHDIRGRVVRKLVDGFEESGSHSVHWDGKNERGEGVPSGIYFYHLDTDRGYRSTRKMVVLK